MSTVVLVKGADGSLEGVDDKSARAWKAFRRRVARMSSGEELFFRWWEPRSGRFHRRFFAFLRELASRQERFDDADALRSWLTVGAGYVTYIPVRDGLAAIPQSLAYDRMDNAEFHEYVRRVDEFLWTAEAQEVLWPHLSVDARRDAVDQLMNEFNS